MCVIDSPCWSCLLSAHVLACFHPATVSDYVAGWEMPPSLYFCFLFRKGSLFQKNCCCEETARYLFDLKMGLQTTLSLQSYILFRGAIKSLKHIWRKLSIFFTAVGMSVLCGSLVNHGPSPTRSTAELFYGIPSICFKPPCVTGHIFIRSL